MQVQFKATDECNGHKVHAEARMYEVHLDGKFFGWVSGPDKGDRRNKNGWTALRKGAPTWAGFHDNRGEAVLAAL
jgi:hypothetical protein